MTDVPNKDIKDAPWHGKVTRCLLHDIFTEFCTRVSNIDTENVHTFVTVANTMLDELPECVDDGGIPNAPTSPEQARAMAAMAATYLGEGGATGAARIAPLVWRDGMTKHGYASVASMLCMEWVIRHEGKTPEQLEDAKAKAQTEAHGAISSCLEKG